MENFNENISKIFGNKIESGQMIVTNKQLFEDEKPHTLTFDFYDGFGFCENYDNKRYYIYGSKYIYDIKIIVLSR